MSDLTFNKIAGGVLATGLTIFLLKEVTTELFATEPPEKPGYAIQVAVATEGGAAAGADVPPDWGTVLPAASIDAGKTVSVDQNQRRRGCAGRVANAADARARRLDLVHRDVEISERNIVELAGNLRD